MTKQACQPSNLAPWESLQGVLNIMALCDCREHLFALGIIKNPKGQMPLKIGCSHKKLLC
jgi:hypothetical protein